LEVVGPPTSGMIIDGPIHAQERISQVDFIPAPSVSWHTPD
jgi:hypothetical protein